MSSGSISLTPVNQSSDANNSTVLVSQKNVVASLGERAVACQVIQNLGRGWSHKFEYDFDLQVGAQESYGNTSPLAVAQPGEHRRRRRRCAAHGRVPARHHDGIACSSYSGGGRSPRQRSRRHHPTTLTPPAAPATPSLARAHTRPGWLHDRRGIESLSATARPRARTHRGAERRRCPHRHTTRSSTSSTIFSASRRARRARRSRARRSRPPISLDERFTAASLCDDARVPGRKRYLPAYTVATRAASGQERVAVQLKGDTLSVELTRSPPPAAEAVEMVHSVAVAVVRGAGARVRPTLRGARGRPRAHAQDGRPQPVSSTRSARRAARG